MGIVFQAEAGDADAAALVQDAMLRLRAAVREVQQGRRSKPVH